MPTFADAWWWRVGCVLALESVRAVRLFIVLYSPAAKPPTLRPQAHLPRTGPRRKGGQKAQRAKGGKAARSSARMGRISTARAHRAAHTEQRTERVGTTETCSSDAERDVSTRSASGPRYLS